MIVRHFGLAERIGAISTQISVPNDRLHTQHNHSFATRNVCMAGCVSELRGACARQSAVLN